jgi:hypothetical protein
MPNAQELIEFIARHPDGVSTEMVAEAYGMEVGPTNSRLGKLFSYGRLTRSYQSTERKNKPTWKAPSQKVAT